MRDKPAARGIHLGRLALKAALLFIAANVLFAFADPADLGRLSAYNFILPGRERFPFGESPQTAYNFSLSNLEAMFASHSLSAASVRADQYRILVLGDSSVWGALLRPEQTLPARLNELTPRMCGKPVRVYNLGYPTLSLTKDLLILDRAMRSDPDLVVWVTTLEAFVQENQLASPIVAANAALTRNVITRYQLTLPGDGGKLKDPSFWERTVIGRRRALADLARLQLYGVVWAATGIDQVYPADAPRAQTDFEADESFHGALGPLLDDSQLALDVLAAGVKASRGAPVLVVNEPILISRGTNSQLRYNYYYPRWAFDQYRTLMEQRGLTAGWEYIDLWDLVPADQFTNTAIHLTPEGVSMLAERVGQAVSSRPCP